MESKEKQDFYHIKNFFIDIKVAPFKLIDKKEWLMQNLRNRDFFYSNIYTTFKHQVILIDILPGKTKN